MPRETTRYAGLAAVALLWSTLGIASLRSGFPLTGPRPLSWLAADADAAVLYGIGLAGGAGLLLVFHGYVRANFPSGRRSFSMAMVAGLAGQTIAAVVPIHGGTVAHTVHTVAALTLGASLPALMWRFAVEQPAGAWRQRCVRLAWLETAACVVGVVLSRRSVAPLAEILPAAVFHLWIAAVTFAPGAGARGAAIPPGGGLGTLAGAEMPGPSEDDLERFRPSSRMTPGGGQGRCSPTSAPS
ncbi:MAG: hypothetical protein ACR2MO_05940 [Acidimicrobiales bacterium]